LGASLRFGSDEDSSDLVDEQQLEQWFRESLDLDPGRARNFDRAGSYFMFMENLGEAERCFARGFRLNRKHAELAKQLADVYARTDRERDALTVLDMCLREGCEDPEVSWQAALTAFRLDKHESTLTYLDHYEQQEPETPWLNYYRAAALLELDRLDEALIATDEEARCNPECPLPALMQRAAATAGLGQVEAFRELLAAVLEVRLSEVDYLTPLGFCNLFRRLWISADCLPQDDPLLTQLEDRMVAGGLAPNELFNDKRAGGTVEEEVNCYECDLLQPLDDRWTDWHGQLSGESDWGGYFVTWGVLAHSEEEAEKMALAWQSRAYPLPAVLNETRLSSEGYRDTTGVVWQGYRSGTEES
jgi:tetratricopeptide (TPR) repeat protein